MSVWDMPWSTALCFTLAGVVTFCVLFLLWDAWRHREPKRRTTPMSRDELIARRLERACKRISDTIKQANE